MSIGAQSFDDVSLQRGDLLLVTCNPEARQVHLHTIEIKWRSDLGDLSAYVALRQDIERDVDGSDEEMEASHEFYTLLCDLALRLAALELHLDQSPPMPFIADDLFINWDDDRARAGLAALARLSPSAIHAREYTTAELTTRFAEHLVNNYNVDADITWLLDHFELHLVPQANPDGRKIAGIRIGQNGQRCNVGVLALIGGHALRCVAFHMFDVPETLLRRLFDILHCHIVLVIQPCASRAGPSATSGRPGRSTPCWQAPPSSALL